MKNIAYHRNPFSYDYLLDTAPTSRERQSEYYLHMHNDYEILFFFGGNADYVIENELYHLQKNSLLFIKPMVYHGLHILSAQPYERAVFNFSKQALTESQREYVDSLASFYHANENSPLYNIFTSLRSCEKNFDKQEFEYLKSSSLYNILSNLHHAEPRETVVHGKSENGVLNEIIKYINDHADRKLDTQNLSDRFFVSKSWIDHTFKKVLKTSPKRYINEKKILYAQSMILEGHAPKDVVELCNYENYATFYRQYVTYLHHEPAYDKKLFAETDKKKR
ncbi:MAG: helix-turn-helix domain-containing protein [Candidatus Scatosoma sp.]